MNNLKVRKAIKIIIIQKIILKDNLENLPLQIERVWDMNEVRSIKK